MARAILATSLCAVAALAAISCAHDAGQAASRTIINSGKADYMEYCASCHGKEGYGDGPVAPYLDRGMRDLTQLSYGNDDEFPENAVRLTIEGRAQLLLHGTRDMPIWGSAFRYDLENNSDIPEDQKAVVARQRVNGLIAYLKSIQDK